MQVFLRPGAIEAISFDLDDTLYDNRPIIAAAEGALLEWLAKEYPLSGNWQAADWRALKRQLLLQQAELTHDTSAARLMLLQTGLEMLGYDKHEAKLGAKAGLALFLERRSDFKVSKEVLALLSQLAERFRLVGITNGNVDAGRIGLGEMFEFVLHPGNGIRRKPWGDMFQLAAERLVLPSEALLHVGDHPLTDVEGARKAGCQAAWLNPAFAGDNCRAANTLLPHIRLHSLSELALLL
ncbi:HAD-IA family hydrolase [Shewanella algae]|uniref:HAD-IA family hydrolase n=1 Tax=Shewanella algae TaxID=38313 RepID=UPI001AAD5FE0|nr:HAD-IA family hydrolase [Shewanella algae]MBO2579775.1 HAD-IA family hydrolase [Shewanella algae]MBO2685402.1 HAD-IA family hydrolase [Shewanella algae]BCV63715.1 haloacid dehalogenase [Shewanella algae]